MGAGSCPNGAGFEHGWAQVETGRRGGTATGAADEHKSLQYKTSDPTVWSPWSDNHETDCGNPCLSNWHYYRCSTTGYTIIKDGQPDVC